MDELWAPGGPLTEDPRQRLDLMRRFAAVMLFVGGLTVASGMLITATTREAKAVQAVVAAVFVACGLIILVLRTRRWLLLTIVVVSVANIGGLIAGSNPMGMAPMGFLWPVAYTSYFFPRRTLAVVCGLSTISLSVGLLLNQHHHLKLDSFVGATASVYVVAGMMASMNRREDLLRTELELTAGTDPLTGLLNRRGFAPQLTSMIQRASTPKVSSLAFVMFDLDLFKNFNDEHGHLVGDEALTLVGDILRRQCGRRDAIARFGGEEFAVAMPGASTTHALAYATRVAAALRREGGAQWRLTISAGITALVPGDDTMALLTRADEALYEAKHAGRDRAAWWDGGLEVGPPFSDASV